MNENSYRSATKLAKTALKIIIPAVNQELSYWQDKASKIPNSALRNQALMSIESKAFHCQGGSIYAVLAGDHWREAVSFIVAYQTISDYLDNLCDRSDSLDAADFRSLHQSMLNAVKLSEDQPNYYQYRQDQNDGGYLSDLVLVCQKYLRQIKNDPLLKKYLLRLTSSYIDLQVNKHVNPNERVDRLKALFDKAELSDSSLTWYEYAASTGSTLTIFCLVSYGLKQKKLNEIDVEKVYNGYFPYLQGLHILLDYLIDQEEDLMEGDLNFCFYYPNQDKLKERFFYFIRQTKNAVADLPDAHFHRLVYQGLIALYLADSKINDVNNGKEIRNTLLKAGGVRSYFFYYVIKSFYRYKNRPIK
ncbi:tetraprenyl-beta-curcumene synthase family protein [Amphibacillus sp. Q70]|uniref:tetraprenyl-beta-curcumene synthase family protein n=1 Tax=Amphibacillus sp. Q70 TaxID=3453416 RepID=UPI003F843F46